MFNWIIENRELVKLFYGLIITLFCAVIVLKADRLFKISNHNGIRYFRNAFFFYGIAFLIRFFFGEIFLFSSYNFIISLAFEFFLIVAGFFLIHSLLWRRFYKIEKRYSSSLFSPITLVFYCIALVIVFLDFFWNGYFLLFASQVIIFILASIISYNNYLQKPGKPFPKYYFLAMVLSLLAWLLNSLAALILDWNRGVLIWVYLLNIFIFFLFLLGVIKFTK